MEWAFLAFAMILYAITCVIGYNESFRSTHYFVPVCTALSVICGLIWHSMTKWINENNRIYVFGIAWDTGVVMVYYLMPILFLGVKLNKFGVIGVTLMLVGLFVMKLGNES